MTTNVWGTVGGVAYSLPLTALLGTAGQLLGMNAAADSLEYKGVTVTLAGAIAGVTTIDTSGAITTSAGTFKVGANQVVSSRKTGWGVPTGTSTRTTFDTATVTTAQLAERMKAWLEDSVSHGLTGA
jgi:hypothetical protein